MDTGTPKQRRSLKISAGYKFRSFKIVWVATSRKSHRWRARVAASAICPLTRVCLAALLDATKLTACSADLVGASAACGIDLAERQKSRARRNSTAAQRRRLLGTSAGVCLGAEQPYARRFWEQGGRS